MAIQGNEYFRNMLADPNDYDRLLMFKNVNKLLDHCVEQFPDSYSVQWAEGKKTFSDLKNDVDKVVALLKNNNVKKNDVVGLLFRNEYDFITSFFACSRIGAVAALLPLSLPNEVIERLSHLFTYHTIIFNDFSKERFESIKTLTLINASTAKDLEPSNEEVDVLPNDPACIVFTGGTTGNPKGALLSHKNLCRGALNGAYTPGNPFNHKYLSLIPFTHIFGLVKNLLSSILSGSTLYLCPNPTNFAREAAVYQPDTMVLTPGLAAMVLTLLQTYSVHMFGPAFKCIIAGGANVPPKLIKDFKKLDIDCFPGYGLTEATNLVSGNIDIASKPDSVGIAYPGQEVKVVDNELWVKGDNVFLGYFNNPVATNAILIDGWLHTGDLATIDEEGYIYILGRINNLIVLASGLKIVPEEIEFEINTHPLVKDSIVRKAINNDSIEAEVLLNKNDEEGQKQVTDFIYNEVNNKINGDIKVTKIIFRNEDFKRTPAMKIVRE